MKRALCLLALIPTTAFGAAYEISIDQRNAANTAWIQRIPGNPAGTDHGLFFLDGNTKTLRWAIPGSGFSYDSVTKVLDAHGTQADWTAVAGPAVVLNKPILAAVAHSGDYMDLLNKPTIPGAQVNADWTSGSGVSQILNKPSLATVATSGAYADLSGKPVLATVATSGAYADLSGLPTIPGYFAVNAPGSRTFALATAYQCTNTAKPCLLTITLQAQSSISLGGASNNEGQIVLGSTNAVASGTGTVMATYKNNLGGTLVIGLNLNSQHSNTYTIAIPAAYYVAVRQTAGSGLQVVSTLEQQIGN